MNPDESLQYALAYQRMNLSVIPVRPDKKPYVSWTEYQKRLATEDEIKAWWEKWPTAMIGIVTGSVSGVAVIDCDTEEGKKAVRDLLPAGFKSPVADTPRGGLHIWCRHHDGIGNNTGAIPGVDLRAEGGYIIAPPSVNGNGKGYRWRDSKSIFDIYPPPELPARYFNLLININKNISIYRDMTTSNAGSGGMFQKGRRDDSIFHVANTMLRGGAKEDEAVQVIQILARNCDPPFPEEELKAKIKSALNRSERRQRALAEEIREWVLSSNGVFLSTDVPICRQLSSREERKNFSKVLSRLCDEGIIERHGSRNGTFRRVDRTIEFMDFENADPGNSVDLQLPLDVQLKTKIFPKGVVVIAGVSGMGKTLFALNAIHDNMGRFPIYYFNSEMGPEALKKKLTYFPTPVSKWARNMKVVDNWDFHSIADKVQPDAFNVIDYLEPEGDKPYNIHGVISAVIRKLKEGTALICVQKKPEARMGTGGIYSIKAATLALALDWGKIEIVKNRFREEDPLPSLNKLNFEVHRGYRLVSQGGWYK
ncbi:bifunctional DNA primase/polymerase [Aminivibrio sp.]|uniref:bifunctional DNA primase/polymerase n=1 Tax=Aminivibrio sp. TaxID=1872489 RepID=UPI00345E2D43